jgi:hypothetical protein
MGVPWLLVAVIMNPSTQAYAPPHLLGHETTLRSGYTGCFDYAPLLGWHRGDPHIVHKVPSLDRVYIPSCCLLTGI